MSKGRVYSKSELKVFNTEATDLILWAQQRGATVRIGKRGHAIIYSPDGVSTTCIPPTLKRGNRSYQNSKSAVERMLRQYPGTEDQS